MENTVNRYLKGVVGKIHYWLQRSHTLQFSTTVVLSSYNLITKDPKSHTPIHIIIVTGILNNATFWLAVAHLSTCITLEKQKCKHRKFLMVPSNLSSNKRKGSCSSLTWELKDSRNWTGTVLRNPVDMTVTYSLVIASHCALLSRVGYDQNTSHRKSEAVTCNTVCFSRVIKSASGNYRTGERFTVLWQC